MAFVRGRPHFSTDVRTAHACPYSPAVLRDTHHDPQLRSATPPDLVESLRRDEFLFSISAAVAQSCGDRVLADSSSESKLQTELTSDVISRIRYSYQFPTIWLG